MVSATSFLVLLYKNKSNLAACITDNYANLCMWKLGPGLAKLSQLTCAFGIFSRVFHISVNTSHETFQTSIWHGHFHIKYSNTQCVQYSTPNIGLDGKVLFWLSHHIALFLSIALFFILSMTGKYIGDIDFMIYVLKCIDQTKPVALAPKLRFDLGAVHMSRASPGNRADSILSPLMGA